MRNHNHLSCLVSGDTLTYVSSTIERTPNWYTITYAYRDARGNEYFHTHKFDNITSARKWQTNAKKLINVTK